jgi:imidazolonepropionase-like amidohydrolase
MKDYKALLAGMALALAAAATVNAQDEEPPRILITNVNIFDGVSEELAVGMSVLVEGNLISAVATAIPAPAGSTIIDGGGRTLMPGIIEAHGHVGLPMSPGEIGTTQDWQYAAIRTIGVAKNYLDHGWTTVRDAGGMVSGIKKAIDEGHVPGPRIYPSGMFVSQTSGHGDFRRYADAHPNTMTDTPFFNQYYGHVADGVAEVQRAVREELRKGAVHIKVMAGGGIASTYDPIHTTQYSLAELQAAVEAASDWGTYVLVHAYTDQAVSRAIDAGVKVIEHGQLMTEETARKMAENDVWLSTQVLYATEEPTPEQIAAAGGETGYLKWKSVSDGTATSIAFAKEYGIKIAFGTDLWGPAMEVGIANEFTARKPFFSNVEILQQATSVNGELLRLTGPLNPYPDGPIGEIVVGAYADLLLVDGNPLENIELLTDPENNLRIIMKNGVIYKNTL